MCLLPCRRHCSGLEGEFLGRAHMLYLQSTRTGAEWLPQWPSGCCFASLLAAHPGPPGSGSRSYRQLWFWQISSGATGAKVQASPSLLCVLYTRALTIKLENAASAWCFEVGKGFPRSWYCSQRWDRRNGLARWQCRRTILVHAHQQYRNSGAFAPNCFIGILSCG